MADKRHELVEDDSQSTPTTGRVALYAKTDGKVYIKDDTGSETDITTASSGIGGALGSTDNAVLRADGTGGSTAHGSPVVIDDTGKMSNLADPTSAQDAVTKNYADTTFQDDISGLTLTGATVAPDDKVLLQDTNDSDNLKTVTAQSIADLAGGGGVSVARYTYFPTSGTTQANYASGAWRTMTLDTEALDPDGIGTLTTNTIQLGAGTYIMAVNVMMSTHTGGTKFRLRDTTGNADIAATGLNPTELTDILAISMIGAIVLSVTSDIELQVYPKTNATRNNALGITSEYEPFSSVTIMKVG